MKSVFAVVALAVAGILFYWLLASSEPVQARKVVQPPQTEAVSPPPDAPLKKVGR